MTRFFTKRNNGKYVNAATGEVQVTTPEKGWLTLKSRTSGKDFYYDLVTGKKSFHRPLSFFTKRNNGKYVNTETDEVYNTKPTEGWTIRKSRTTGKNVYENLSGKEKPTFTRPGTSPTPPPSPNSSPKPTPPPEISVPVSSNPVIAPAPGSPNLASKLAAAERELAELRRQLASTVAPAPALPTVSEQTNNPAIAKFKRMISMGIPRPAVEQKMRMEGLEPSMLNGPAAPGLALPSAPFRPAGNPMAGLMSGILGGPRLKKTNGPQKAVVENAPKDPKKEAAMDIAAAAAAKRAEMAARGNTRSIEERLANSKKAKGPAPVNPLKAAITGFKRNSLLKTSKTRKSRKNRKSRRSN